MNYVKSQERLSTLNLKRHGAGGAVHHHSDSPICRGCTHIEFPTSRRLAGYLTVFTGMFAAKSHHKDVQLGSAADVVKLCPDFGR